jgi:hypothetical protein
MAEISSKGTQESSSLGQALQASAAEVQSRVEPRGQSPEPRARSRWLRYLSLIPRLLFTS